MVRRAVLLVEMAILSALVPAARCANYQDVFAPEMFTSSFRFCVIGTSGFGPNEMEYARRVEQRDEWVQLRDLAISLELVWQPGVAGSSHESPKGNCRERAIFRDGRLARSACNSGKSGVAVRARTIPHGWCRIPRPSSVWQCPGMLAAPF